MIRLGDVGWWAFAVAGFAGVALWNGLNFVDAPVGVPRTKDLTFLPKPEVAEILACGQQALAAKLRWIDSFDYFELQIDLKNDQVAGEAGLGYTRLYDILLGLDPLFRPYYDQAALNLGAVESRHFQALGILLRGTMVMPTDRSLWQQAAIELYTTYDLERRHPQQMSDFLEQWASAMTTDRERQSVLDWMAAMERRQSLGLAELPYWQEQLERSQPGSQADKFITATIQGMLATFGRNELQGLADAYTARHLVPPQTLRQLLDPDLINARYPHGLPPWGPVVINADHHFTLRSDPLGFPYELLPGPAPAAPGASATAASIVTSACHVVSRTEAILNYQRRATSINLRFIALANTPPTSLEAMLAAANPGPPPTGTRWAWRDNQLVLDVDPAPTPAWAIRPAKL